MHFGIVKVIMWINILLNKIIQFMCRLISLLAVFEGITTTSFYLNHTFQSSSK